jgi:hypothetical protein
MKAVKVKQNQPKTIDEWKPILGIPKNNEITVKAGMEKFDDNYESEMVKVKKLMKTKSPFILFKQVDDGVIVAGIGSPNILMTMGTVLAEAQKKLEALKVEMDKQEAKREYEDDRQPSYVN